jgi:hypothetical protein
MIPLSTWRPGVPLRVLPAQACLPAGVQQILSYPRKSVTVQEQVVSG